MYYFINKVSTLVKNISTSPIKIDAIAIVVMTTTVLFLSSFLVDVPVTMGHVVPPITIVLIIAKCTNI